MPASLEHQQRVLAFCEATERKASAKAVATLELVTCLALARKHVPKGDPLHNRISLALLNSYLAFQGDVKPDLPKDVIPIWSQHGFDPERAKG